jgi:hypothetical protein
MKFRWFAFATASVWIFCGQASAATVTVNQTLDVHCASSQSCLGSHVGPPFSVNVSEGDTLDLTFDFLGEQQLTATGISVLESFISQSLAIKGVKHDLDGVLSFLSVTGTPVVATAPFSVAVGVNIVGAFANSADGHFVGLPSTITFGGLHYSGVVTNHGETRTYERTGFYLEADDIVLSLAAVPEPATWAMLMLGFAGVGFMARRRSRKDQVLAAARAPTCIKFASNGDGKWGIGFVRLQAWSSRRRQYLRQQ